MLDIEVLDILKIMCEVMEDLYESRKFDSQTIKASNGPSCKTNRAPQIKTDHMDVNDTNANMPHYFRSCVNRAADKRTRPVFTNKIHNKFSGFFLVRNMIFEDTFSL